MRQHEAYRLMGKRVHVTKELVRIDDEDVRCWVASTLHSTQAFDAWIVKVTWKCDGKYEKGYVGSEWDNDVPGYLSETKRTWCVEVRTTPGGKTVLVPMDGFELKGNR